ncbi:uncharacterized protein [Acropora muricata]|uniref:uncharacterized protein n=1 Tax=Acropora muricata TaxID=159855 RepID=UPI0034E3D6E5
MAMDNQQKSATLVYRAGTKQGPCFDLNDESIEEVWLVTSPELFFPLGQDLPLPEEKRPVGVCLWTINVSNLRKDFTCYQKYDRVIQVVLKEERNSKDPVKKIQTALSSLKWDMTTVPKCKGGLSLMNLSPLVQAVKKYMKDHCPNSAKELNFHAELKAASQWCLPDDYEQLVMKKVPVGDCRLKIAVTSTLKTWEEKVKELQMNKPTNIDEDNDSPDECVDERLSDYREAIGVLKKYLKEETSTAQVRAMAANLNLHEQGPSAIQESEDQRSWRECEEAVVKLFITVKMPKKELQEVAKELLTQLVHNYVRFKSCSEDNIGQELRQFTSYLIEAYSVRLGAVHEGSVVIILGCHTLEGLELLWKDYRSGHLDKVAERYLLTEEIKRKLNLERICLKTVIEEENYSNCKKALMKLPSTSSGKMNSTSEPQQLVRIGGKNDPFEEMFRTVSVESYGSNMVDTDKRVPGGFDFLLDGDKQIIPERSCGLALFAHIKYIPVRYLRRPERFWKLKRVITHDYLQKYDVEIKSCGCGAYVLKPTKPVTLETFTQMLRSLPWVKMY